MDLDTPKLIKDIIDNYALEKVYFLMFINENGLSGEFSKWCAENIVQINSAFVETEDN